MEKIKLSNFNEPDRMMTESLRALKTNLQFCGLDKKVIAFTSATPDEGKSVVVMNLARSLVASGKRVLVVDTDMRKSVLVGRLGAATENGTPIYGLSHLLSKQKKVDEVLYAASLSRLYIIFAGPSVPNPTELLDSTGFDEMIANCREGFDYILIDCAPMGAAIDGAVVAKRADGVVLVIAQGQASIRMIQDAKKQLETAEAKILGVVLNKMQMKKHGYYGHYYGSYYGSYYADKDEEKE